MDDDLVAVGPCPMCHVPLKTWNDVADGSHYWQHGENAEAVVKITRADTMSTPRSRVMDWLDSVHEYAGRAERRA